MNKKFPLTREQVAANLRKAFDPNRRDERPEATILLKNIKGALPELEKLLEECHGHWGYEDPVYRFYHQSFKVYDLQERTAEIVEALKRLAPPLDPKKYIIGWRKAAIIHKKPTTLNEWFLKIVKAGTGKTFEMKDNERWLKVTRPILEAFFHSKYFLEMAVRYGKELKFAPAMLPSGWAALLYLYDLR